MNNDVEIINEVLVQYRYDANNNDVKAIIEGQWWLLLEFLTIRRKNKDENIHK